MGDYYCACDPSEGEPWTILTSEVRTARKAHQCEECLEQIKPGDRYHYFAGIFEGAMEVVKRCAFCQSEVDRIAKERDWYVANGDLACCLVAELRGEL